MDVSAETAFLVEQKPLLPPELLNIMKKGTNGQYLDAVSRAALNPEFTDRIFLGLEPLSLEICARWTKFPDLIRVISAFGRILPLAPHLTASALSLLDLLSTNGDALYFVDEVRLGGQSQDRNALSVSDLQCLLIGTLRLLRFDDQAFSRFIRPAKLVSLMHHRDRCVRHLAVRLMCCYMYASDAMLKDTLQKHVGLTPLETELDGKVVDLFFFEIVEENRIESLTSQLTKIRSQRKSNGSRNGSHRALNSIDFSASVACIHGVLLPRKTTETQQLKKPLLVPTQTMTSNMQKLARALLRPHPVLIRGGPGSGKTCAVNHVASQLDQSSMITLHLNEQSDAKLLLGIYATGSRPGTFEWHPGVITTAVTEGRWLFIEDLDRTSAEVMSVLLPLIERRECSIPGRYGVTNASENFRILASLQVEDGPDRERENSNFQSPGSRCWQQVQFDAPTADELMEIISARYVTLKDHASGMLSTFRRIQQATTIKGNVAAHIGRIPSTRDLFKWCARTQRSLQSFGAHKGMEALPESFFDHLFLNAIDCLLGPMKECEERDSLVHCITEELSMSQRKAHLLLTHRVPSVKRRKLPGGSTAMLLGRAQVPLTKSGSSARGIPTGLFVPNPHGLRLMERVSAAIECREPLLLVGETGIGKTAAIQHVSQSLGQDLFVFNLSQQSESGDLLGGYKPVSSRSLVVPLKDQFDRLFSDSFSFKKNQRFKELQDKALARAQWKRLLSLWRQALQTLDNRQGDENGSKPVDLIGSEEQRQKRRRIEKGSGDGLRSRWEEFARNLDVLENKLMQSSKSFTYKFQEGRLVKAVRDGCWVLLDEINLATTDTLEAITDLLESGRGSTPSLLLAEAGMADRIRAHPNFRVFASMNPSTDVGKRDLPPGVRSRFTEIFVESPDRDAASLRAIVDAYFERITRGSPDNSLSNRLLEIYSTIQALSSDGELADGSGERPNFSLRTLTRALSHASSIAPLCSTRRALFDGFAMCFSTFLSRESEARVLGLLKARIFKNDMDARKELTRPVGHPKDGLKYVDFNLRILPTEKSMKPKEERLWLPLGSFAPEEPENYIVTPYVGRNLKNLVRAVSTRKFPVLVQGPTSAGKTSMVEYLARRSGNKLLRINNHEHTDLQEYLGTYVSGSDGNLIFQEGLLVQAVRHGYWIVLDELNLAPSDVLESLNRLLDENREIFVPENQEIVKSHPDFMLFATQNPVGAYGGRKALSMAFRNRFLELHFDDLPVEELNLILARRSSLPESWCALIVEVYKKLSQVRSERLLFERHSFATLRDLFRWAFRGGNSIEDLARTGYMLLAEKMRSNNERQIVKTTIEEVMSRKGARITITEDFLYSPKLFPEIAMYDNLETTEMVWTNSMRRLYSLVSGAVRNNEPVLLVGETGCGKTAVCQMLARALNKTLTIVNAYQNLETGDLIGSQRPKRDKSVAEIELVNILRPLVAPRGTQDIPGTPDMIKRYETLITQDQNAASKELQQTIRYLCAQLKILFEWQDGPVVQAMRGGNFFLLDEISLADDSVLERMNSLLDPQRSILLAEKGSEDAEVIAKSGFQFLSTMNPGGDFGKKELSPALRNRFTEIWVPPLTEDDDVLKIVTGKIQTRAKAFSKAVVDFSRWFGRSYRAKGNDFISIRDVLSWVKFINKWKGDVPAGFTYGALTVFVDTLGANPSGFTPAGNIDIAVERGRCIIKLQDITGLRLTDIVNHSREIAFTGDRFAVGPFSLPTKISDHRRTEFNFIAPTTRSNALRILRAMQISKPILLEGDPGVGKTSLVSAIASCCGRRIWRLNLSEQTDLSDLFGSDVPIEGEGIGEFAWRDAPFLSAMKKGDWVLLDEMNLASQSVLEGLNACIDHRGEVYIPELDRRFSRSDDFFLFAAQNPHHQGGGRKGLPTSFVNRFTVVYADALTAEDLNLICTMSFPSVDGSSIRKLVCFLKAIDNEVNRKHTLGNSGGPWEFNLRDAFRCLQLLASKEGLLPSGRIEDYLRTVVQTRFRTGADQSKAAGVMSAHFEDTHEIRGFYTNITANYIQVGRVSLSRNKLGRSKPDLSVLQRKQWLPLIESIMMCIGQKWPVILTGSSGAGKSLVLRSLAAIMGAELQILSLSTDLDSNDLVGAYEQLDPSRGAPSALKETKELARALILEGLQSDSENASFALLQRLCKIYQRCDTSNPDDSVFEDLSCWLAELPSILSNRDVQESQHLRRLLSLRSAFSKTVRSQPHSPAQFTWIDGPLVKALERGCWLVLDNANFCSASVLDRLNSLLEPGGTLIMNENCSEDGVARVIHPHPDFRIFLTMDPKYGEVSRAMRNRAVEISMLPDSSGSPSSPKSPRQPVSEAALFRYKELSAFMGELSRHGMSLSERISFVEHATNRLPEGDITRLGGFSSHSSTGQLVLDASPQSEWFGQALQPTWTSKALQSMRARVYQFLQPEVDAAWHWQNSQPVHILVNEPLIKYNRDIEVQDLAHNIGRLQELHCRLGQMNEDMLQMESDVGASFGNKSREECLELSKKIVHGGDLTFLACFVVRYLCSVFSDSVQTLARRRKCDRASTVLLEHSVFFARYVLDSAKSHKLDEMRFNAIVVLGHEDFSSLHMGASPLKPQHQGILRIFKNVNSAKALSSGLSMETLWYLLKPRTPPTFDRLQQMLQMEETADELDRKIQTMLISLTDKVSIRQSFVRALEIAFEHDVSANSLQVDYWYAGNKDPSEGLGDRRHQSAFSETFKLLSYSLDLVQVSSPTESSAGSLSEIWALLGGRSTKRAINFTKMWTSAKSLYLLSGYFDDIDIQSVHKACAIESVSIVALKEIGLAYDVPLSKVDSLIRDVGIMSESLAQRPDAFNSDHLDLVQDHLECLVSDVLKAHADLTDKNRIQQGTSQTLRSILKRYLEPCYQSVEPLKGGQVISPHQLGQRLACFSLGCIALYVPDQVVDPALHAITRKAMYDARAESLQKEIEMHSKMELFFTGQSRNLICDVIQQELESMGPEPAAPTVARPQFNTMKHLHTGFRNVLRLAQMIEDCGGLRDISNVSDDLMESLRDIISHLKQDHGNYRDIVDPVIGFLHCLICAIRLGKEQNPAGNILRYQANHLDYSTPLIAACPLDWQNPTWQNIIDTRSPDRHQGDLYILMLLSFRSSLEPPTAWTADTKKAVTAILDGFHQDWQRKVESDRKADAAASSLYHYRGIQDEDSKEEQRQIEEMFAGSFKQGFAEFGTDVARLHIGIFQDHFSSDDRLFEILIEHAKLLGSVKNASVGDLGSRSSGRIHSLSSRLQSIMSDLRSEHTSVRSIYDDHFVSETLKLRDIIFETQTWFLPIMDTWIEHATLHNILLTCQELLRFRWSEPLIKYLTKTEQLHGYVTEWQSITSKQYSAIKILNRLTDLLVSWRQLEMSSWARLLDQETERCQKTALSWWFTVYESLVIAQRSIGEIEEKDAAMVGLVQSLEDLLSSSSIGEYSTRLRLLESLYKQMSIEADGEFASESLQDAVKNLCAHFHQRWPLVRNEIEKGRRELEKEIRNIIQLASWKDRNILALRESARSSHRKLFYIVRRYRRLLGQPVSHVLSQKLKPELTKDNESLRCTTICDVSVATVNISGLIDQLGENEVWVSRPLRLRRVLETSSMMRAKARENSNGLDSALQLDEYLLSLEQTVKQLRESTIANTSEENASLLKHFTTRKRRILADTLRDLRYMGFRSAPNSTVLSSQASLAHVFYNVPCIQSGTDQVKLQESTAFFHAALDLMPQVRNSVHEHSDDLNQTEVTRSVGILEGLLAMNISQRQAMNAQTKQLDSLCASLEVANSVWVEEGCNISNDTPSIFERQCKLNSTFTWLPTLVRTTIRLLNNQAQCGKLDFSNLLGRLQGWATTLENYRIRFRRLPPGPPGLVLKSNENLIREADEATQTFQSSLETWKTQFSQAKMSLDQLLMWTKWYGHNFNSSTVTLEEFNSQLYDVADKALASMQDMTKMRQDLPISTEERNWLLKDHETQKKILQAFNAAQIAPATKSLIESMQNVGSTGWESLRTASLSLFTVLPILREYYLAYRGCLASFASLHHASSKALYQLSRTFCSLSSDGFCKPAKGSGKQSSASEKLEAGTGLGEGGEGVQDISKDVGEDDDFDELAQGQGDDRGDRDEIEDHKDAVNIGDDLEGAAAGDDAEERDEQDQKDEDAEGQDNKRDVEGEEVDGGEGRQLSNDEESEDVDEGVGDVNDFEPSAVDEKFWDQTGQQQNKEKESKRDAGSKRNADDMVGADDSKQGSKDRGDQTEPLQDDDGSSEGESVEQDSGIEEEEGEVDPSRHSNTLDPFAKKEEGLELPDDLDLDAEGDKGHSEGVSDEENTVDDVHDPEEEARRAQEELDAEDGEPHSDEGMPREDNDAAQQEEGAKDHTSGEDPKAQQQEQTIEGSNVDQNNEDDCGGDQPGIDQGQDLARNQAALPTPDDQQQLPFASDEQDQRKPFNQTAQSSRTDQSHPQQANQQMQLTTVPAGSVRDPRAERDQETIRKLGDALEKFHRQHQDKIHEKVSSQDQGQPEQRDIEMDDAQEFEHLRDEQETGDTQALGPTDREQMRAVDQKMALDAGEDEEQEATESQEGFLPDIEDGGLENGSDISMQDAQPAGQQEPSLPTKSHVPQSYIGESQAPPKENSPPASPSSTSSTPSIDEPLQTMHLEPNITDPVTLWHHHVSATRHLAITLTNQFRLILSPTRATKLRGDYRTGKRLNLKRIIPYIASGYRRDKIWMRRSVPSKRAYQIMLAVDDSKSMLGDDDNSTTKSHKQSKNGTALSAPLTNPHTPAANTLSTLALLTQSLTSLESGDLGILSFGESPNLIHPLGAPFSPSAGADAVARFSFAQHKTDVRKMLEMAVGTFADARARSPPGAEELWQLLLVVSDGVCEDHEGIRKVLMRAEEERVMVVFVVVDAAYATHPQSAPTAESSSRPGETDRKRQPHTISITDLETVEFAEQAPTEAEREQGLQSGEMKLVRRKYLDTFPFKYFVVVRDVADLPDVLASALRSWFAEVAGV